MSNGERGMMKYAPYQSLVEQSMYLAEMRKRRSRVEKPTLFSDVAEEINEILTHYEDGPVIATYWDDGFIHVVHGRILYVDALKKAMIVEGIRIPFGNIQSLKRK